MKRTQHRADFLVARQDGIGILTPMNRAARQWLAQHVQYDPWQVYAGGVALEARMLEPILEAIRTANLTWKPE